MNAKKYLTLINEQQDGVKGGGRRVRRGRVNRDSTKTFAGLLCGFLLFLFVGLPLLPLHLLPLSLYCSRCIV